MAIENSQKPLLWLGFETLVSGGSRTLLLLAGGIVVAAVLGWHVVETRFYRAALPAEIGLSFDFATTGSNVSVLGAVFLFDRKACGGAIFDLTDTTVAAIRERVWTFSKTLGKDAGTRTTQIDCSIIILTGRGSRHPCRKNGRRGECGTA